MDRNNYRRLYKAVGSIEELLATEEAEVVPGNNTPAQGGLAGRLGLRGATPVTGTGTGQGQRSFRPARGYYPSPDRSGQVGDEDGAESGGDEVGAATEEEPVTGGGEDLPSPLLRHRARPLRPGRSSHERTYQPRARPRFRHRIGDRTGVKPVGAFAGLCLGLVLWYLGGLCFAFTATTFKLTALKPVFLNYWPWLLYALISYVQAVYLPRSLRDLAVMPWYILLGVIALTAVDLTGSSGGALQFWAGKSFQWGTYAFAFNLTDAHTIILSLLCGVVISLGAEPVTRFFWNELADL